MVNPDAANTQLENERIEDGKKSDHQNKAITEYSGSESKESSKVEEPDIASVQKTRFYGHIETDATCFFRITDDIEKEILKHLNPSQGVNVKITIHIEALNKEGFNQDVERTLRENGRTLGFGNVEFE